MEIKDFELKLDLDLDKLKSSMDREDKIDFIQELMEEDDVLASDVGDVLENIGSPFMDDVYEHLKIALGEDVTDSDDDEPVFVTCPEVKGVDYDSCSNDLEFISKVFERLDDYDKKRVLCDALWVGNYYDNNTLMHKLESIINAR